jgi:hypothetical protein
MQDNFYNERIEGAYLCCLITSPASQKEFIQDVTEWDFYVAATRTIFLACKDQLERDGVIESVTLWDFVDKSQVDFEYYREILACANDPDVFGEVYKKKLKEFTAQRKIKAAVSSASQDLENGNIGQAMEAIQSIQGFDTAIVAQDETCLLQRIEDVGSGKRFTVQWPWFILDGLTNSFQPGSMTIICGGVGASKSFMVLQMVRYWLSKEVSCKCLMMEEDKPFHLRRAIAQATGSPWITSDRELYQKIDEARELYRNNVAEMKRVSMAITVNKKMTQTDVKQWIEIEAIRGSRVICVDPITAADNEGKKPWEADKRFISDVENIACKHGVSLLFVNHPVKGSSIEPSTGSMSGGSAWERFTPTILWLEYHEKKTKPVNLVGECFAVDTEFNRTIHLSKTRYGSGQGICLAANFDNLSMKIEGIIQKGKKKSED